MFLETEETRVNETPAQRDIAPRGGSLVSIESAGLFRFGAGTECEAAHSNDRADRNRVMRLCGTLEKGGYLIQDLETRNFSLGFQVMVLGKAFEKVIL